MAISLESLLPSSTAQTSAKAASLPENAGRSSHSRKGESGSGSKSAVTDTLGTDERQALANAFEGSVYQKKTTQLSLVARMRQVQTHIQEVQGNGADGGAQSTSFSGKTVQFSFQAEARMEQLTQFTQRTSKVAEGLRGDQQTTYAENSQKVAMRFSMSIEISSTALEGYAEASEALAGDKASTALDQFNALASKTLEQANAVLTKVMELLKGFFDGSGDMESRFMTFMQGLQDIGLIKLPDSFSFPGTQTANTPNAAGQGSTTQTQFRSFGFKFSMNFEFIQQSGSQEGQVQQSDPITLDLDGDGIELTSHTQGARFDILGNGKKVTTAFVTGGDAFLAIDRDGDGIITSGKELFGDQNGASNGFEELRKLDSNMDGVINADDADFSKLLLFKDNGNGIQEDGELLTLAQAGISEISLRYSNTNLPASGGNQIAQVSSFKRTDGTSGLAVDSILNYRA